MTDEDAKLLAEKYLKKQEDKFFYRFKGINRCKIDKNIISVLYDWSDDKNIFAMDGPLIINIDMNKEEILSIM